MNLDLMWNNLPLQPGCETRSAYSSIFSTIQSVAGFIIMNLLGVLTEWNGVNAAWCVAAVAMGVDIVILVIFSRKYRNRV